MSGMHDMAFIHLFFLRVECPSCFHSTCRVNATLFYVTCMSMRPSEVMAPSAFVEYSCFAEYPVNEFNMTVKEIPIDNTRLPLVFGTDNEQPLARCECQLWMVQCASASMECTEVVECSNVYERFWRDLPKNVCLAKGICEWMRISTGELIRIEMKLHRILWRWWTLNTCCWCRCIHQTDLLQFIWTGGEPPFSRNASYFFLSLSLSDSLVLALQWRWWCWHSNGNVLPVKCECA